MFYNSSKRQKFSTSGEMAMFGINIAVQILLMKRLFSLAFLMVLPFFFSGDEHKFYVSTTIIHQNTISQSLEITIKLFSDDLENALQQFTEEPIRLGDEREHSETEEWLQNYLQSCFSLHFNDRPVVLNYIGKEVEYDLTYVYFELLNIPEFNILNIKNEILFDQFEDQVNIVHLRIDGWEQTLMFDKQRPEILINR